MSARWRKARNVDAYGMARTMDADPGPASVLPFVGSGDDDVQVPLVPSAHEPWQPYEEYQADMQYRVQYAAGGTMGDGTTLYTTEYPGAREDFNAEWRRAAEYDPSMEPQLYIKDLLDYNEGGQFGLVNNLPYSVGVVSSDAVENYDLTGEQVLLRRETEARQMHGPVGTADSSTLLAIAYAQQVNQFYPDEASQADLVVSV